jgi:hypothetical protein
MTIAALLIQIPIVLFFNLFRVQFALGNGCTSGEPMNLHILKSQQRWLKSRKEGNPKSNNFSCVVCTGLSVFRKHSIMSLCATNCRNTVARCSSSQSPSGMYSRSLMAMLCDICHVVQWSDNTIPSVVFIPFGFHLPPFDLIY